MEFVTVPIGNGRQEQLSPEAAKLVQTQAKCIDDLQGEIYEQEQEHLERAETLLALVDKWRKRAEMVQRGAKWDRVDARIEAGESP